MFNPEFSDLFILAGKCKSVISERMRKTCAVKVKTDFSFLCPVDPALKMFNFNFVTVNKLTTELTINSMKVQPLFPRKHRHYLIKICPHLLYCCCFAGEVSGNLYASAAKFSTSLFKSSDIIGLPAVQADAYLIQLFYYQVSVYAKRSILGFCQVI